VYFNKHCKISPNLATDWPSIAEISQAGTLRRYLLNRSCSMLDTQPTPVPHTKHHLNHTKLFLRPQRIPYRRHSLPQLRKPIMARDYTSTVFTRRARYFRTTLNKNANSSKNLKIVISRNSVR